MADKSIERIIFSVFILFLFFNVETLFAQDTLQLKELIITGYPLKQNRFNHTSSVEKISMEELSSPGESLIKPVNSRPGIRMEERSPGSFRFSVRGSLLRSPFGIRNVKFYFDDFIFTDGGGNTYLNLLDKNSFQAMEIYKGPNGSFFGANTGGAVLINSGINTADSINATLKISYASFKTIYAGAGGVIKKKSFKGKIFVSDFESDGYRNHSRLGKKFILNSNTFIHKNLDETSLLIMAAKINYQTPGGLTIKQSDENPESSRPATALFKSAEEQKAGVENLTLLAGVAHKVYFKDGENHTLASVSMTGFENPFITNFETRDEKTFSVRNVLRKDVEISGKEIQWTAGAEGQHMDAEIFNYGNNSGVKDTFQVAADVQYLNGSLFGGFAIDLAEKLIYEMSASGNLAVVEINSVYPDTNNKSSIKFSMQLMPRFAFLYSFNENNNARVSEDILFHH
jgi:iron complex outermembrane receptor protein